MAKALNRVTLLGNLGQDPDLRSTPQGTSVCNLNIATSESYKDKGSGEWKEVTDWHRVVLWEGLADVASNYLKKGDKVYIEGKLKTRSYEQDGITKYITEVRATNMIMMGKSSGGGSGSYQQQERPSQPANQKESYSNNNDFDDIEDDGDVPF